MNCPFVQLQSGPTERLVQKYQVENWVVLQTDLNSESISQGTLIRYKQIVKRLLGLMGMSQPHQLQDLGCGWDELTAFRVGIPRSDAYGWDS
jgi:hypothetical protein